jgi:hypothetical protein
MSERARLAVRVTEKGFISFAAGEGGKSRAPPIRG